MQTWKVTGCVLVICLIVIGFFFLAGCTQKEPSSGVVKTDAGYVSGINQNGIRVYHGIPFAVPPTGNLRWRPPAPVQPYAGQEGLLPRVPDERGLCLSDRSPAR